MDELEKEGASEDTELGIDVEGLSCDCMNDPVLVNASRQMNRYENETLNRHYDESCTACVMGDKRVPGYEYLKGTADPLCPVCKGTGRIPRTPSDSE